MPVRPVASAPVVAGFPPEDVLPDVVMVLEHGIWQVARIAQHDEQRRRKLVCLAHSMQAVWYEDDSVQKPDRRLGTKCKTLADLPDSSQASITLSPTAPG